jgi:hypothetical protein
MDSDAIQAGLHAIRIRRAVLAATVVGALAFFLLAPVTAVANVVYLVLLFGLGATWLVYVTSACPGCSKPFFAQGDSVLPAWRIEPFRLSCANCGLSVRRKSP